MFVSANFLAINYGVDDTIAKFFVDRQPPPNNLYWHEKLMYLRTDPGWLFIPLAVDLLFKAGVSKSQLLAEEFLQLMEQIGHISAEEELKHITKEQALEKHIQLVEHSHTSESFYNNLVDFMRGGTNNPFADLAIPFKALHRGDAFLFSLCALDFDESLQNKLVEYWFALISTLLLLDDAEDMEIDKISGDDNAFLESGLHKDGVEKVKEMVRKNLQLISGINKVMAIMLDQKFVAVSKNPHLQQLLTL